MRMKKYIHGHVRLTETRQWPCETAFGFKHKFCQFNFKVLISFTKKYKLQNPFHTTQAASWNRQFFNIKVSKPET